MKKTWLVISFALFSIVAVRANESFPEYGSLTEEEQSEFEGPNSLNSEYFADLITYKYPEQWEYHWFAEDLVLGLNAGSLDGTHFLMDNRLKLHTSINEYVDFRFTYFDDRDFDKKHLHHIFDVIVRPVRWLGISIYGELDHFKRKPDTGLALLFYPSERHEIRVFNTFVDVTLLKRNDRSDRHIVPFVPHSRGVVGRVWSDPASQGGREYLKYAFRYDTKTKWEFPDDGYLYEYWRIYGSLLGSKQLSSSFRLHTELEYDRKFESRLLTSSSSTSTAQGWTTTRFVNTWQGTFLDVGPKSWELSQSLSFAARMWNTTLGRAEYRDWVSQTLLTFPGYHRKSSQDKWSVGPMFAWHRSQGATSLFDEDEKSSVIEARFHVIYEFVIKRSTSLRLVSSADLNEFGTQESWDGGNAQFVHVF